MFIQILFNFMNENKKLLSFVRIHSKQFNLKSFHNYSNINISENIRHKMKTIINEFNDYSESIGSKCVVTLSEDDIKELIVLEDRKRLSFYKSLLNREKLKQKYLNNKKVFKIRNELNKSKRDVIYKEKSVNCDPNSRIFDMKGNLLYGLWRNSLFTRIAFQKSAHYLRHKLRNACLFGPKLLIDMSFEYQMTRHECKKLVYELQLIYRFNKYNTCEAFDIHLFNISRNGFIVQYLSQAFNNDLIGNYIQLHFESYLDCYSRESLVYLSPDANQVMDIFDCDMHYIIGGFVDKYNPKPLTIEKANNERIKTLKLPIDELTIDYRLGNKLFISQVFQILNTMKDFNDYKPLLRNSIDKWRETSLKIEN